MHFFRDSCVTDFCSSAIAPCIALISYIHVTMRNRHTVLPVHKLRAGAPARSILMYPRIHCCSPRGAFSPNAPTFGALTKKSLFFEVPLNEQIVALFHFRNFAG